MMVLKTGNFLITAVTQPIGGSRSTLCVMDFVPCFKLIEWNFDKFMCNFSTFQNNLLVSHTVAKPAWHSVDPEKIVKTTCDKYANASGGVC